MVVFAVFKFLCFSEFFSKIFRYFFMADNLFEVISSDALTLAGHFVTAGHPSSVFGEVPINHKR